MNRMHDARLTYDSLEELLGRFRSDNPKAHVLAVLTDSFNRFGYLAPPLVNEADGKLLVGHGRLEALDALRTSGAPPPLGIQTGSDGEWLVPTLHGYNLSAEDALAYLIADNRTTELGGWHEEQLAAILGQLATAGGLDGVGYSADDLDSLLASLNHEPARNADPDDLPEEPAGEDCYVRPGDLWVLGNHRLLCGDATRPEDLFRLLGGRKADLLITDPPYNVDYGRHGGADPRRRREALANDALDAAKWMEFIRSWTRQLPALVDGELYIFMSSKEWPCIATALEQAGCHWSDTLIWAKDTFTLGRSDYQRQYEPIWYGWPTGATRHWCGDRDQGDVWPIARPRSSDLHPTMKPVGLIERALRNSSRRGALVLDIFLGSGTTLIAAERLGLHCRGIELEPRYVQVCIERWQVFTGRQARKDT